MDKQKYTVWVDDDNVSNPQGNNKYLSKEEAEELVAVWINNGWHNARIEVEDYEYI